MGGVRKIVSETGADAHAHHRLRGAHDGQRVTILLNGPQEALNAS